MAAGAASSSPSPPTPLPARTGEVHDAGAVRRDALRAARWTARGAVKVLGDADIDAADLEGLVSIRGSLKGGVVRARGTLDVGQSVELAGSLTHSGQATVAGALTAQGLVGDGTLTVGGTLAVRAEFSWKGEAEIGKDLRATTASVEGRIAVHGTLTATEFRAQLRGASTIGEIRADRVAISRPGRWRGGGSLTTLSIEGRELDLTAVHAQYVKAERLTLGPGCRIAAVVGTIVRRHPTAEVGPASESPPPYGLTR